MNRTPHDEIRSDLLTLPNLISAVRIALVPVFIMAMIKHRTGQALLIFFLAGISDLLDGFAARIFHVRSRAGMILDPAGDKLLMSASYVVLTIPSLSIPNAIPLSLTVLVFLRDLLIVVGALIAFLSWRQSTFFPSLLGKFTTAFQVGTVFLVLLLNDLGKASGWLAGFYAMTFVLTLASGTHYFMYGLRVMKARRNAA